MPTLQPKHVLLTTQLKHLTDRYTDVVTLMSPINSALFQECKESSLGSRPEAYEVLKSQITENIIEFVTLFIPELKPNIAHICAATPLTYQHYTATPDGCAYGVLKDYRTTMATLFPARTKLDNLYLAGQNNNVHGALGVTLSAATTCSKLIGADYLARKIAKS